MVYVLRKIHVGVTTSPNSHQGDMGSFYYHLLDLMLMEQLQDECMLVYVMVPCLPTFRVLQKTMKQFLFNYAEIKKLLIILAVKYRER